MTSLPVPRGVDPSDPRYVENPATGERMLFHTRPDDPASDPLRLDIWAPPGMDPLAAHVHPEQEETLTVEAGAVTVVLDDVERTVEAGESVTIPVGTPHTWWPSGDEELHLSVTLDPGLQTEDFFRDLAALARRGEVRSDGAPSPLRIAAMFDAYGYGVLHLASPPLLVQKVLFGALAPIARLMGYQANPVEGRDDGPAVDESGD